MERSRRCGEDHGSGVRSATYGPRAATATCPVPCADSGRPRGGRGATGSSPAVPPGRWRHRGSGAEGGVRRRWSGIVRRSMKGIRYSSMRCRHGTVPTGTYETLTVPSRGAVEARRVRPGPGVPGTGRRVTGPAVPCRPVTALKRGPTTYRTRRTSHRSSEATRGVAVPHLADAVNGTTTPTADWSRTGDGQFASSHTAARLGPSSAARLGPSSGRTPQPRSRPRAPAPPAAACLRPARGSVPAASSPAWCPASRARRGSGSGPPSRATGSPVARPPPRAPSARRPRRRSAPG